MIGLDLRVALRKRSFLRLLSQAGLVGACFSLATSLPTSSDAQEPLSSRRLATTASMTKQVPQAEAPNGAPVVPPVPDVEFPLEVPARLPPVQYEMLPALPPPPPGEGPNGPVFEDARDVYGRPVNVGQYGLKYRLQNCYWGFPEYFEERPLNMYNQRAYSNMIGNGQGDFLVLYQYDFCDGSNGPANQLNDAGYARVARIIRMVKGQPRTSSVVVESVPGAEALSRARQQQVAAILAQQGVSERSAVVSLGKPRRGLLGDEAVPVYRNLINLSTSQGGSGVTGTTDPTVNTNTTGTSGQQGSTGTPGR